MIQHRDVVNAVRDAIFLADMDTGMIVDANPAAEALCGRSLAELRSLHHTELHPPEVAESARRGFQKDTEVPGLTEGSVLHKDGHRIPVEIASSHFTGSDGRRLLVGVFRDTTEWNRVRDALRQSEERFRQVAESAGEFIWEVDANGLYLYASPVVEKMLGYTPEEVVGRMHFYDLFAPEAREETKAAAFEVFARREPFRAFPNLNLTKDGRIVVLETSGVPILDGNGNLLGYRGADTDVTGRKQAEAALHESQERFRATFFQAAVGIAHTGLDGKWLLLNDRFCEIIGYSQGELSGKTFLDVTHPDDREASLAAVRQLLAGEISSWTREKRYIRKDGATVWARLFTSLVRDQNGRAQYFISVVDDITEKIQAVRALRETEQRLTLAQKAARLGVWDRDLRTGAIAISGEYARLYGLAPERTTITQEEWLSLIHPDDRELLQAALRETRNLTHPWNVEFRVIWPDGSVHWLLGKGTVFFDDSGQPIRAAGVTMDITERKQAEAALRESEERFESMANTAPVMIWISGLDKLCTFFNRGWLEFTGRTMEQELGNGWTSGVHPEDLNSCLAIYSSSFDARRSFQLAYRLRRADGEYRWVLDNGRPLYRGGEFYGYIGSCIDVTEQKLVEERLRASETRLMDAQRLARVGSWERDANTDAIHWSDEMHRIYGVPNVPSNFQVLLNQVHPADRTNLSEKEAQVHSSTEPVAVEFRIIRPDGEVCFVRSIVEAIRNDQGALVRIVGATQDITEQVKARELLRESEERLTNAERLAHVGSWHRDLRTSRVTWSEEMFRIFGKSQDYTPTFEGFLQAIIPQDRERAEREIRDSLEQKSGHSIEFQIARPNGDLRTVNSIAEVARDEEGFPVRIFGACQDITDLRRVQEEAVALSRSERLYRAIGESIDYGVWVSAPDGRHTYSSESFLKLVGLTQKQCSDFGWGDVLHPDEAERTIAAWKECVRTEGRWDSEQRFRGVDGEWHPVLARGVPVRDEQGRITCWAGINLDISGLKRAEEALRQSEARVRTHAAELEAVLDAVPAAVFVSLDPECRHMIGSRRTYEIVGLPPGSNVSISAPEDETAARVRPMKNDREVPPHELPVQMAAATGQAVRNCEFDLLFADGSRRNLLGDAVPLLGEDGRPRGAVGAFLDITERKRAEERLRQTQKLDSVGLLAGGIAHDFNNLLTSIMGNASMVLDDVDPKSAERIKEVISSAERAAHLTRQLLAYSGKGQFVVRDLDVSEAINEITGLVEFSIPKSVQLAVNVQRRLPIVRMDPSQLQQILMNLLINAGEAIGEGNPGRVTVATSMADIEERFVDATGEDVAPGRYVSIAVSDTGSGIDEEKRARIFDPFFTTKFTGRGLGLAAVAGILRSHKGAITLDSAPGHGSTFQVFLPAAERYVRESEQQSVVEERATVLVVDDEVAVRDFIGAVLRRQNYRVVLASDGREALAVCEREGWRIDAAVLDVVMPLMGANDLMPALKSRRPEIRILLTSGYSEAEARRLCAEYPGAAFIQKPYTAQQIARAVDELLGVTRS